jgi:putative transcriptional regulator
MGKGEPRISNTVRTLRFHAGEMTQAALAEKVGVTRQTIVAIEQGRYSPSLEVAVRLARAFNVPLEQAFSYDD